jgi:hypothetical protein
MGTMAMTAMVTVELCLIMAVVRRLFVGVISIVLMLKL